MRIYKHDLNTYFEYETQLFTMTYELNDLSFTSSQMIPSNIHGQRCQQRYQHTHFYIYARRDCNKIKHVLSKMLLIHTISIHFCIRFDYPDNKVHGANMGPTWVLSAPDGPHVGPIHIAIRVFTMLYELDALFLKCIWSRYTFPSTLILDKMAGQKPETIPSTPMKTERNYRIQTCVGGLCDE